VADWSRDIICPFCGYKYPFAIIAYCEAMEIRASEPCVIKCKECDKNFAVHNSMEFLVAKLADCHQD
jgi:hypothetical protein